MAYGTFNEEAQAVWDFVRCQRDNGSHYGTRGECRKGKEVGEEEKEENEAKSKKESVYKPREGKGERGVEAEFIQNDLPRTPFQAEKYEKDLEKIRAGEVVKWFNRPVTEEEVELELSKVPENLKFMENLKQELPKDVKLRQISSGSLTLSKTTKSGHKVDFKFGFGMDISFEVNGGYDYGTVKDRKEQMEVAGSVREMYDSVIRSLPVGAVIRTSPYGDDGKGKGRANVYEKIGFSAPDKEKVQYAVKLSDGSMAPPKGEDPKQFFIDTSQKRGTMYFAEGSVEYSELTEKQQTALWRAAIFGV